MNRILLIIVLILGSSSWALGQATPAAAPESRAAQAPPGGGRSGISGRGDVRPVQPPPAPLANQLTPSEQVEFKQFMRDQDPSVSKVLANLPPSPARRTLTLDFINQWRELNSIKNDEPLKSLRNARIGIQDAICGDMITLATNPVGSPQSASAEGDMRTQVTELVKNTIDERDYRITKLNDLINREKEVLAQEKDALEKARAAEGTTIDQRVNAYNQGARQLGAAVSALPGDQSLQDLFFGDVPNPPDSTRPSR
jgi:hypothetical protein